MTIGGQIKKQRLILGWSQEKLARKLGVSTRAVFKWEHDETFPRSDSLEKLAKIFNVPLDYFFQEKQPDSNEIPPDILEAVKHPKMQEFIRAVRPFILDDD